MHPGWLPYGVWWDATMLGVTMWAIEDLFARLPRQGTAAPLGPSGQGAQASGDFLVAYA